MYTQVNKVNAYKKIAFNFLFLVLALIALVAYFVFYKVEIFITPVKESVSADFFIEVRGDNSELNKADGVLDGSVQETETEGEKEFSTTGTKEVAAGKIGKVFIVNKENFNQPLVATTRLLTPDNILFRLSNGVTVPAHGEIEVEVYADQENFSQVVAPTKMTVPGLSPSLQETIYAENRENLGKTREVKILTQEDINVAKEILAEELYSQAKEQFNLKNKNKISFNLIGKIPKIETSGRKEIMEMRTDKEVGSEADNFKLYLKIKAIEVSFDERSIIALAEKKILESVPDDKKFIGLNKSSFNYSTEEFDMDNRLARIKVYSSGSMVISEESRILDKNELMGKSINEVKEYLKLSPAVESVEIKTPFNLLKSVPKNRGKIKIIIKAD